MREVFISPLFWEPLSSRLSMEIILKPGRQAERQRIRALLLSLANAVMWWATGTPRYDVIRQKHRIVIRYAVITTVTVITGTVTGRTTNQQRVAFVDRG